jgi:hypothetical protein
VPTRTFRVGDDVLFTLRFRRFPNKWSDDTGWDDPCARFAVRTHEYPFGSDLADPGAGSVLFVSPPMLRKARLDGSFRWCFRLHISETDDWVGRRFVLFQVENALHSMYGLDLPEGIEVRRGLPDDTPQDE